MTWLVCVEAAVIVAAVFLCLRHISQLEASWADERRELLNRIQRPEIVPVKPTEGYVIPDQEPDGWNDIGEIVYDPDYGTE